jgi:hypothetical protein
MKEYGAMEAQIHVFLDGCEWSASKPDCFRRFFTTFDRRLEGHQNLSEEHGQETV